VNALRSVINSRWGRRTLLVLSPLLLFLCWDLAVPFRTDVPYARAVTDVDGRVLTIFLSADDKWRLPTELDDISEDLRTTIIYKEDKWFRWHPGVNPAALLRAAWNNVTTGRRTSGASTITMQVARLLNPKPRTWYNKALEIVHSFQLELHHSKDEILQLYLNLVPYGGNIEGVKAASVLFFDKMPKRLSLGEITTLAIIPNRPTSLRLGASNMALQNERDRWLRLMYDDGAIGQDDYDDAVREPLIVRRIETPRKAWHLAVRLRQADPNAVTIRSTIRAETQDQVETLAYNHIQRLRPYGIYNASVVVVDNRTMDVVAYVGSADPSDVEHSGQVDGVRAIRSPGSTLKPFVYGMAFDRGLLTPKTMLSDVPVNYDGYAPENYDRHFNGAVSMEQALARSLNIPAVTTLHQVGVATFVDALARAGCASIGRKKKDLGLSVILGGCGTRLDELVRLYAGLAHGGAIRPLRWTHDVPRSSDTVRLLSPGAAWIVTESLTQLTRPDLPNGVEAGARIPKIAWKTGTSYGRRDAWSIGYNRRYTIGVWVGNFSGNGVQDLTGSTSATPLLFDIVNTIDRSQDDRWTTIPQELDERLVCSVTGLLPADSCQERVIDVYLPGVSSGKRCEHLKEVAISADGRMSYCTSCLPPTGYRRVIYPDLPPPLLAFYRGENIPVRIPPPHNPSCTRMFTDGTISIVSPLPEKEYILETDGESRLQLRCAAMNDVETVYWYLDDVFLTSAPSSGVVFIEPGKGRHEIGCLDNKGRSTKVAFTVRYW